VPRHNGEGVVSSINGSGKTGYSLASNDIGPLSYIIDKNQFNSKSMKELNVRPKIIKLLEENRGGNFIMLGLAMTLGYGTKAQVTKAKIDK